MYRTLSDLRVLRLATYLEDTMERYEESLRNLIPEVPVRACLAPLFEEGDGHKRLKEAVATTSKRAADVEEELETEDVLQVLLECEKVAHSFYLDQLDRLSNPTLVALFQVLAAEERSHMSAVEGAIRRLHDLPKARAVPTPA